MSCVILGGTGAHALAADVSLVGLIGAKAIVVIDGGQPRTLAPGHTTAEGVRLIDTDRQSARFVIDGKTRVLTMGQAYVASSAHKASVTLAADPRGHFVASGAINGGSVRLLVDTGATFVSLPASEARRLGIDFMKGERARVQTANGVALAYRVKLDTVSVGALEIHGVDAVVSDNDALGIALLGMSFLNRVEMTRDGPQLTLTKRF